MTDERVMLDQLLQVECNNHFYRDLHQQYQKYHKLTPRQTECLQKDYNKKLARLVTENMDRVEIRKPETETPPAQHNSHKTGGNRIIPTPETTLQYHSIEEFLKNFLERPEHGTREEITDHATIKAILGLIKNRMVKDCSHYHGYNPHSEAKYQKTTFMFKGNQLFKNGVGIDCRLDDPTFEGMRINSHEKFIDILLDFYHPEQGYGLKCVNFDVRGVMKTRENKKETATKTDKTLEPTQKTNNTTKNTWHPALPTKEETKKGIRNKPADNNVLVDPRKRTPVQLEKELGKLNQFKLFNLYNTNKISFYEYESFPMKIKEAVR